MRFLNFIYPPKCVLCGKYLNLSDSHKHPCVECLKSLPFLPDSSAISLDVPGFFCIAPFNYVKQIRTGVLGLKFKNRTVSINYFAETMYSCLKKYLNFKADFITWVPLSLSRNFRRGFNQSKLLAQKIAVMLDIACIGTLYKIKNTPPNSRFATYSERMANVHGSFIVKPYVKSKISGSRIILVDDVLTTGSTVGYCAELLHAACADYVTILTLAKSRMH